MVWRGRLVQVLSSLQRIQQKKTSSALKKAEHEAVVRLKDKAQELLEAAQQYETFVGSCVIRAVWCGCGVDANVQGVGGG